MWHIRSVFSVDLTNVPKKRSLAICFDAATREIYMFAQLRTRLLVAAAALSALTYRWVHVGFAVSAGPASATLGFDASLVTARPEVEAGCNVTTGFARLHCLGFYGEVVYDRGYQFKELPKGQ
jgi:hypothetical protein